MVGMGALEMMFLIGLLAGGGSLDIASSLPAKEYFKARDIEVSADRLMELAVQNPDSSKKQIGQLFALAHLASDPDLLKKSAKMAEHRRLLGEIARGKKANDPNGFAVQYAERVLLALAGQQPLPPAKRSWKEIAKFFPENASFIGLIDLSSNHAAQRKLPDMSMLFEMLPKEDKEAFWSTVEKIGNIQVDSFGVGLVFEADNSKMSEIVVRFSGKGNSEWLASSLTFFKEDKSKERAGPNGEKVRVFVTARDGPPGHDAPVIALIGDSEVIVCGYEEPTKKDHRELLDHLLAQRVKTPMGPVQGRLKENLAKVPADANGLIVGSFTKDAGRGAPFPLPTKVTAHAKRVAGGIDVQAQGVMADEMGAKGLIETIGNGRNQAIQELNKAQGQPIPIPGFNPALLVGLLESIQLQSSGNEAQFRMLVPDDAMMTLPMMFGMTFAMRARAMPPQAVPAPAAKEVDKK